MQFQRKIDMCADLDFGIYFMYGFLVKCTLVNCVYTFMNIFELKKIWKFQRFYDFQVEYFSIKSTKFLDAPNEWLEIQVSPKCVFMHAVEQWQRTI